MRKKGKFYERPVSFVLMPQESAQQLLIVSRYETIGGSRLNAMDEEEDLSGSYETINGTRLNAMEGEEDL